MVWLRRRPPALEGEARRLVLLTLPPDADADVQAPLRQHVDGCGRLGQDDWTPQRGDQDVGGETDPGGHRGEVGNGGDRVEPGPVGTGRLLTAPRAAVGGVAVRVEVLPEHDVVREHKSIDAGLIGGPGELDQGRPVSGILCGKRTQAGRQLHWHRHSLSPF
jgi:hypothetical protein